MKNVLITGANRGIGLEFTKQYLHKNHYVFATCRSPEKSTDLLELKEKWSDQLQIIEMDVSNENSIINASEVISKQIDKLDILINNAGTYAEERGLSTLQMKTLQQIFSVNTFGPLLVSRYFTNLLCNGDNPIIASLFSGSGFISEDSFAAGGQYSYGASKAALNICIKYMAADLKQYDITVIGIGPGYVLTDMTKGSDIEPPLMPEESVSNMISSIGKKTIEDTGLFFENDGRLLSVEVEY